MDSGKNAKQLVNEYCQREKLPNPAYVCTPDREKSPNGYFCVLTVSGQTFRTINVIKSKKNAELEAAKLACEKLKIQAQSTEPKESKKSAAKNINPTGQPKTNGVTTTDDKTTVKKTEKPTVKEPGWITIEKVEDIYKHLSDEVLAQEFKSFLHCKAQEEKKDYPVFTVNEVKEGECQGFTCVVKYDGKDYKSLGLMNSKKQAEQSASEVCLRALGNFPAVSKDKYTIQVWTGGKLAVPQGQAKKVS